MSKLDSGKPVHLFTFVLTLACTITCLIKIKGGELGDNRDVSIALAADCRTRLDLPLPITYFGNCVMPFESFATEARNLIDENGFAFVIDMLNDLVQEVKNGVLEGAEKKAIKTF